MTQRQSVGEVDPSAYVAVIGNINHIELRRERERRRHRFLVRSDTEVMPTSKRTSANAPSPI